MKLIFTPEGSGQIQCEHKRTQVWEPHLAGARKCLDCKYEYNPNRTPAWQPEPCKHEPVYEHSSTISPGLTAPSYFGNAKCYKCGVELVAEWKAKE